MSGTVNERVGPAVPPVRVGLVTPAGNPAVEPEITGLLPRTLVTHTARLPVLGGLGLRERLRHYNDDYPRALASFGGLPLRAALLGCTGSSYPLGPDGDARLGVELTERLGAPVITAARSVLTALAALGVRSLVLVSPYPAWLTEQCAAFLTSAGHRVSDVAPVPGSGRIYDLAAGDVERVLGTVRPGAAEAVLVAGTGAPSLPAVDTAAERLTVPVLSSNLCGAWLLAVAAGAGRWLTGSPSPALRRLAGEAVPPERVPTSRRGPST